MIRPAQLLNLITRSYLDYLYAGGQVAHKTDALPSNELYQYKSIPIFISDIDILSTLSSILYCCLAQDGKHLL